jgi:ribonuclease R
MINKNELIEEILKFLRENDNPQKLLSISKHLNIRSQTEEYNILKALLSEMENNNLVSKSSRRRYSLYSDKTPGLMSGTIRIQFGKGIVETSDTDFPKVTVKRNNLNTALDGDEVCIQLLALKRNQKARGEVTSIMNRAERKITGKIEYDGNFYFLVPDDNKYYVDFLIPEKYLNGAKSGDKVTAVFLKWTDSNKNPEAMVNDILGVEGDIKAEFDAIIQEFNLNTEFRNDVIKEAEAYSIPDDKAYENRLDLRDKTIITIDPFDARDFDDALSLDFKYNGNYLLGVHIADVSHYVTENTELDIEARIRGNSTYLVDRVIPMLPEQLSNNVCSLNPNEPRFAFSVFMEISPSGDILKYDISESIIISKRRFTYEEVQAIIDGEDGDYKELLLALHKLSSTLRKRRFEKGGIEFDTSEVKFILNEKGMPVDALLKTTTPSTALVEEAMLAANQSVAKQIDNYKFYIKAPFVYRIHDKPDPEKIREALRFVNNFGKKVKSKNADSKEINNLLQYFKDKPEKGIVNQVLIRSMQKAIYSAENAGHYGLGFSHYAHFTSPIRRYPDLIVHRLLKEYAKENPDKDRIKYLNQFVKSISNHCSSTERNSMEAERASSKLTHSIMASDKIGEVFEGIVSGVTSFGLFITLDNLYAEGLLHIKDLIDDYYIFDDKNYRLIGRKKKKIFSLGSKLKVKIIKANIEKRSIDLAIVSE